MLHNSANFSDGLGINSFFSVLPLVHLNHNNNLKNLKYPYKKKKKSVYNNFQFNNMEPKTAPGMYQQDFSKRLETPGDL